ncbi:MAG: hypothetical protein PHE55_05650 [Methylococcaceae bacterium]|nr:hypothetical protein [Methylococcaceae bacterium]
MKPDFLSPEFIANPYRAYAQLREQAPVYPLAPKTWLLTRYRDADRILRDGRFGKNFSVAMSRRYGRDMSEEPVFRIINAFLLLMNPPEHTRLRGLIGKAFSVRRAHEQRMLSKRVAERLVDEWIHRGEADLIEVFAYPLPVRVICTLLGIELEHSLEFQKETQALAKVFELRPYECRGTVRGQCRGAKTQAFFPGGLQLAPRTAGS